MNKSKAPSSKKPSWWLRVAIPGVLLVVWMAIAGIGGPYFGRISEVSDVDPVAFLPKSAESTQVNTQASKFRDNKVIPTLLVFTSKAGDDINGASSTIAMAVNKAAQIQTLPQKPSPPILSEDKKAILVTVLLDSSKEVKGELKSFDSALKNQSLPGLEYKVTGPAGFARDLGAAFGGIDSVLLFVALGVVFVILLIVYRSPILPFVVLMASMVALTAAILVVWHLAKADILQLNGQVQGILFILVIGAATDYSLLYVARYKEELQHTLDRIVATQRALKGAFEPIIASAGTVIAGLLCLLVSDLASNKALGPVGSVGIIMAVLSAFTFLPAALALIGRFAFWPFMPRYDKKLASIPVEKLHGTLWPRVADFVQSSPRKVWIGCVMLLLAASLFAPQIKADGVPQSELIIGTSEARDGQKILNKHFADGLGSPVLIISPVAKKDAAITALEANPSIDTIYLASKSSPSGQIPVGKKATESKTAFLFKDIPPTVADSTVLIQATLSDAPDSNAAKEAIKTIRKDLANVDNSTLVGGTTAIQLDTITASVHDRNVIIPMVLFAITLILMLLLRSILAPILLLLTTILSFTATLGVATILFQNILRTPGMDPSVVLYGFVFLVALGIDYNIFLMTRVREETIKSTTRKGVLKGLIVTGGVITSAGVVLAATFAALGVIPILFLLQLAFIVAFGVLLDTLIVRSLLVPALIHDIGPIVWWPSKQK